MKNVTKKLVSAVVASSVALSLASCADKAGEQVMEAADEYAKAVCDADAKAIKDLSNDLDDDTAEAIDTTLGGDLFFTDYDEDIVNAILGTMTYEIDEESLEASTKDGEGEVTIVFTLVDYEALMEDDEVMVDPETFIDAIGSSDATKDYEFKADFELVDEEWLVNNTDDLADVYDFYFVMYEFPVDLAGAISGTEWWWADDDEGNYTNTSSIELDLNFNDYSVDYSGIYYTVEYNGELVYTSESGENWGIYGSDEGAVLDDNWCLPAGSYKITFYDENGNELASDTATVTVTAVETAATTEVPAASDPVSDPDDVILSGDMDIVETDDNDSTVYFDQTFVDNILRKEDGSLSAGWWDYSSGSWSIVDSYGAIGYNTSVETIAYSIEVDPSLTDTIYFEYYYSADGMFDDIGTTADFSNTIAPTVYSNAAYYDIDYDLAAPSPAGSYLLLIYDASHSTMLMAATINVE